MYAGHLIGRAIMIWERLLGKKMFFSFQKYHCNAYSHLTGGAHMGATGVIGGDGIPFNIWFAVFFFSPHSPRNPAEMNKAITTHSPFFKVEEGGRNKINK
jgi:hypothetical protein